MGFNVVDVVGGLSYSSDVGPLGYTVNLHRRPISSSLLAFGGQKDNPNDGHTGKSWGGVRADGGGVSLSYDKGEANGVWSSLGVDQLTGKNVADNWRVRWMTGYYYKVVNEDNRRVTVGLNNMLWHYDKDLSGYTGSGRLLQSAGICLLLGAGHLASADGELVMGAGRLGVVVPFAHQNRGALSAAQFASLAVSP